MEVVRRVVPEYGVEGVPDSLRKEAVRIFVILALVLAMLAMIGLMTFRPVPPPAPATAPAKVD